MAGLRQRCEASVADAVAEPEASRESAIARAAGPTATLHLYVDGVGRQYAGGPSNALTSSAVINFGRIASGNNYYAGSLDEIAIYDTVLSGATITAHYNTR